MIKETVPYSDYKANLEVNFFLSQVITGRGCFRYFRCKIRKLPSGDCPECHTEEMAEHILTKCLRFSEGRPAKLDVKKASSCSYMEETVKKLWTGENGRLLGPLQRNKCPCPTLGVWCLHGGVKVISHYFVGVQTSACRKDPGAVIRERSSKRQATETPALNNSRCGHHSHCQWARQPME